MKRHRFPGETSSGTDGARSTLDLPATVVRHSGTARRRVQTAVSTVRGWARFRSVQLGVAFLLGSLIGGASIAAAAGPDPAQSSPNPATVQGPSDGEAPAGPAATAAPTKQHGPTKDRGPRGKRTE